MELILASASPRRRELLRRCGFDFQVIPGNAGELTCADDLTLLPQQNALLKAAAVADAHPDALVLGADTMILFDGQAVGKPANPAEAAEFLRAFSGRTHEVVTGLALISRNRQIHEAWHEVSLVTFKTLSETDISGYLAQVEVLDKAGAYAIQEHGDMLISTFSGEVENIIGLPLKKLCAHLHRLLD